MTQTNPNAYGVAQLADDYNVDERTARRMTIRLNHDESHGTVVLLD